MTRQRGSKMYAVTIRALVERVVMVEDDSKISAIEVATNAHMPDPFGHGWDLVGFKKAFARSADPDIGVKEEGRG